MGQYRIAEVCPNGHVSTDSADLYPDFREEYCSQCGEKTMTHCLNCKTPIRGDYECEVVVLGNNYTPPAYCHSCGNPFPWTQRRIDSAVELAEFDGRLTENEVEQLRSDLEELTKDSPKVQVASLRFNKVMGKVGKAAASGVRDIIVDVLSETAKKALFG